MTAEIRFRNVPDLLKASPFDVEYNAGKSLTEELFYKHFHVESEQLRALLSQFHSEMFDDYQPNRVIFMKGYAGNGKTTFLHTFRRNHVEYNHVYCDFQGIRSGIDPDATYDTPGAPAEEIKLVLNRRLRSFENIDDTFRFVHDNCAILKNGDFISYQLYHRLSTRTNPDVVSDLSADVSWMDQLTFKDTFAYLFIHLLRESQKTNRRTIIYFDNLDVAPMQYLADRFLQYFQDAVSSALYLSQHDLLSNPNVDFRNDYKFVFSLRDANEAQLNAHLADRFPRARFAISFDADTFAAIVRKRISYLEEYHPAQDAAHAGSDGKFSAVLDAVLRDEYFNDVFLPLYNYNYREIVGVLVEVVRNHRIRAGDEPYPRRGTLMFGLIQVLLRQDFLQDYKSIRDDKVEGYCYIDRVMLTVLINCSNYRRRAGQKDHSEPYGLLPLVKDLDEVYRDVNVILDSVARCFLSHKSNRVHLVTVLNTKVGDAEAFVREYSKCVSHAVSGSADITTVRTRNDVNSVLVRVNPAGLACVRYVLPHFEFYSNLVENESSLFHDMWRKVKAEKKERYAFEIKIDKVLELVERHVRSMWMFFESRYTAAGLSPDSFRRSKYCFRHQGRSQLAKPTGHSHAVKIITSQIDYIDRFRRRLINTPNRDAAELVFVNGLLVQRIRGYVALLDRSPDREYVASFSEEFGSAITTIEKRGYEDRGTKIRLSAYDYDDPPEA